MLLGEGAHFLILEYLLDDWSCCFCILLFCLAAELTLVAKNCCLCICVGTITYEVAVCWRSAMVLWK